jgi:hypothetical protein
MSSEGVKSSCGLPEKPREPGRVSSTRLRVGYAGSNPGGAFRASRELGATRVKNIVGNTAV